MIFHVDFGEKRTVFQALKLRLGKQELKVPLRRVEGGYQPAPVRHTQQELLNPAPFVLILRLPKPHCVVVRDFKRPFVQIASGVRAFLIALSKPVMDICPLLLRQNRIEYLLKPVVGKLVHGLPARFPILPNGIHRLLSHRRNQPAVNLLFRQVADNGQILKRKALPDAGSKGQQGYCLLRKLVQVFRQEIHYILLGGASPNLSLLPAPASSIHIQLQVAF